MALVGPMIAILIVVVLAALLRRGLRPHARGVTDPPGTLRLPSIRDTGSMPDDYGLLAPAAVTMTGAEALAVQEQLREAGIRSTRADTPDGQVQVLVFGDQVVRARRLVGWTGPKPQ